MAESVDYSLGFCLFAVEGFIRIICTFSAFNLGYSDSTALSSFFLLVEMLLSFVERAACHSLGFARINGAFYLSWI